MTTPAAGLFKQIAYKREVTFGTIPAAATAQALRRVSSVIDLAKDTYLSAEIKQSFQKSDYRHGVRRVKGKITGDLQCKTYADFFALALKRDFTAGVVTSGASITIAGTGPTYTIARAAGSWLTDGEKIGHVGQLSVGTFNVNNLGKNIAIVAVTALVLTVIVPNGATLTAEGPIAAGTWTTLGKTTFIPQTAQTDNSFSYEHYFPEITASEVYSGCKVDQLTVSLPPTGMAQLDMDVLGQQVTTASALYFTSPTGITTTGAMAAVNGVLRAGGVTYAILTGLTLTINPGFTGDPVVGSNIVPFLFAGSVMVSGQFTAYFPDTVLRDAFLNETEIDLLAIFTANNGNSSDFLSIHLPRIKVGSANKTDGEGGIVQTFTFQALEALTGGAGIQTEKTTIQIQDNQA